MTENLQDPMLDGDEEPLTPDQIARQEQIAVGEELIEAAKAFHLKTAAYVMSMDHYIRVRRAIGPDDDIPEEQWQPVQGDMLSGYPVMVIEGEGIKPHIEMVEKDLRPSYYAGVTSLGIERKDMTPPPFPGANDEETTAAGVHPGPQEESTDDARPHAAS
jgi:hypothetical protein